MIRRLVAVTVLTLTIGGIAGAAPASAARASAARASAPLINTAGRNVLCLWNIKPLNIGWCLSI